ncbi:MAG: response regulator [Bacteroidetes bacterium B1(2017)]|jgi:two-component system, chemotaxis family, chemotaxis protein CheY|nr:response regulator [Leadbetterella sp.]OYU94381.1 MAG: response regulator [Bacteroidetes bacterium B1(2017)]
MKVLVVDDEVDIQDLFLQKFRKEIRNGEIEFSFAISGENALVYLHEHESEAILILSDINMPGMSGIELLREIVEKNTKPKPIVMMITAYGDDETRNKALSLGADDFLNKPLDFGDLKERLFKR